MGRRSKTGGVAPARERIQLTFVYRGERCRPTLDLPPTPPNLKHAARYLADIKARIRAGTFDLATEFPEYRGLKRFGVTRRESPTVDGYIERWTAANSRLKPSTLNGYRKIFKRYWSAWFGPQRIGDIQHSEIAVRLGDQGWKSNKTYNNVLTCGRVLWDMALADNPGMNNPVTGIAFLDVQRSAPDPLTVDEIDALLPLVRERWGDESADYCEFAFFSGLRPGEQIELRWPDVDLMRGQAAIARARFKQEVREVKNYDARVLELHSRALAVIERQRARTQLAGGHVFMHPRTSKPYADERAQRGYWAAAFKLAGLRYREPYQTRHSYATMLLMAGANPAWAARQMGHSPQVFLKVYARWIDGKASGIELAKVEKFTGDSVGKFTGK